MGVEISIPANLSAFFAQNVPETRKAELVTNLIYMMPLEGIRLDGSNRPGHSPQAPAGMVRINMPQIDTNFYRAMVDAVEEASQGGNIADLLDEALIDGIMYAAQEIVTDTPIDTGRARNEWRVILPDDSVQTAGDLGLAPPISAESRWDKGGEGKKGNFGPSDAYKEKRKKKGD